MNLYELTELMSPLSVHQAQTGKDQASRNRGTLQ
ncbi:hypothetical protein C8K61_10621 [Pseudomonas sp. GV071]|nr:hypothetical protein C8K61_10621 [Pseudomonas sp. GV071]